MRAELSPSVTAGGSSPRSAPRPALDRARIPARHAGAPPKPVDYEHLFLDNLEMIESSVARVAWRGRLTQEDSSDFRSHVFLKLVEKDYDILRRFEGRSTLPTYLAVVVQRLFQDYRNHLWGKWRPSTAARLGGAVAVHLERLMTRDGLTFDEAVTELHRAHGVEESREALWAIAERFPARIDRRLQPESALAAYAEADPGPEAAVARAELQALAVQAHAALERAVSQLDADTRAILRLCFWEGMAVSDIARSFGIPQRPLYRRIERVLLELRAALAADGLADDAKRLIAHLWSDLVDPPELLRRQVEMEDATPRPSLHGEVTDARR
jgi:RNA polymerase sigma factor (sigma-70 family)